MRVGGRIYVLAGLTLLMVSVAGFMLWRRHQSWAQSERRGEVYMSIARIRAAEELYRAEHLYYASTTSAFPRYFPANHGDEPAQWDDEGHPDYALWKALGIDLQGRSRFGYSVIASARVEDQPSLSMFREPPNWTAPLGQPWWILVAEGPTERGGCTMRIAVASFTDERVREYDPPECSEESLTTP